MPGTSWLELVLEVGGGDPVTPLGKYPVRHRPLVRFEIASPRLLPVHGEVLARPEVEQTLFIALLDHQATAYGEVDDGRGDVARVGAIGDQRPQLRRREPVGPLVARGDRAEPRVAAARVPEPEDERQDAERDGEEPVGAQEAQRAPEHTWLLDHTRIPPEVTAIQRLQGRPPRLLFGPAWRSDLLRRTLLPLLARIGNRRARRRLALRRRCHHRAARRVARCSRRRPRSSPGCARA